MKTLPKSFALAAGLAAALAVSAFAADSDHPPGFVDFGKFTAPNDGSQFVEVNVSTQLLGLAAKLTEKKEPEVADLLRNLKTVRVNVIGLSEANRKEVGERIQKVRADLTASGWERVVTVQEKQEDVGVYLKHRNGEAIEGVVVTVIDAGKEAVFVNVVGDIKPEKIAEIGERLNIDPLKKAGKAVTKS